MNLKQFPKRLDSKTSCLRITVPENLDLALEGLIRKVLREQPKTDDIYLFAANYFETLLKIRDKAGANFTVGQLCPFHNDEDAHEMIKLAGTFAKPRDDGKTKGVENQQKKEVKTSIQRSKPKQIAKDKKIVKSPVPDLVKKLPRNRSKLHEKISDEKKPVTVEEKDEIHGEFLTSDPIKELVEKELMMEGKGNEKRAGDNLRDLETSEIDSKNENKSEEQKMEDNIDKKPELVNEKPLKNEEEVKTSTENSPESKEEPNKAEAQTERQKNISDKAESVEKTSEDVKSPTEGDNSIEIENVSTNENQLLTKEAEDLARKEESGKTFEIIKDESAETEDNIHTAKVQKIETKEEEIKKATGEQQPESVINKETKATDENIAEKALENAVEKDSSVINPSDFIETEIKSKKTEDELTKKEQMNEENLNTVETTKNKESSVKEDEEQTGETEDKKTVIESVSDSLMHTENSDEKENVSEEVKVCLETMKNQTAEMKEKANEEKQEVRTDESIKVEKSVEENQKVDSSESIKPKEEKHFNKEEKLESDTSQTQAKQETKEENKEISLPTDKDNINDNSTVKDEQKPNEELKLVESSENKVKHTEEEIETQRKSEETQPEIDQKIKSEELCAVVDVKNIPKAEVTDENKIENETQKAENIEDKTIEEELCRVVDINNIPNEITPSDKAEKTENEKENMENIKDKTSQEDTKKISKEETVEENKTKEIENKILKEEEVNIVEERTADDKNVVEEEQKAQKKEESEELCTIIDVENVPNDLVDESKTEKTENEEKTKTQKKEDETNVTELHLIEGVSNISEKETVYDIQIEKTLNESPKVEKTQNEVSDELCKGPHAKNIPKEDENNDNEAAETESNSPKGGITENEEEKANVEIDKTDTDSIKPPDIIEPDKAQNVEVVQPSEEFQIKTIQTHYYDTLQVPETVTKEYIVHNVVTPPINSVLSVANLLQQNEKQKDENMNALPPIDTVHSVARPVQQAEKQIMNEDIKAPPPIGFIGSQPDSLQPNKPTQTDTFDVQNYQELQSNPLISDSDDLLDIMTPSSGYSLNLSEISWQTVNGLFLDSERRYSSLEREEVRYATPKTGDQNQQVVEEVIHKTVIPVGVDAVPVPPREEEEINMEEVNTEDVDKKKAENESEGSTESRSDESDVPFISVEVKTVIETLDEEKDGERQQPEVEITVEATIDVQDDIGVPQSDPESMYGEHKMSNGKNQNIKISSEELQTNDEQQKHSSSTEHTSKEGSSGESFSSAATEIKRTDSAKRNISSTRSLLSTQSLDLGKRNPLVKTRSLSIFRHGVTDFEVWSTIEKELEEAATKIQSKFRGYKTRKKLQRENAVQITTEESSPSLTPAEGEVKEEGQQSTGEFHDSIVLAEHPP